MKLTNDKKILTVGLGLIGGSYAEALTKKGFAVTAIDSRREAIDYALKKGIIADGADVPDRELIKNADIIVFALYPHIFLDWVKNYGSLIAAGTVATDVTGVKSSVVYEVQRMLPDGVEFIASHPMAGREVYGVENSTPSIFEGANFVVTPTDKNTEDAISLCEDLGKTLGFARVSRLSPEMHDDMIGFLSQLTHCIAVALMTSCDAPDTELYTGDSFRDLTRIARINEDMWTELFMLNKEPLMRHIDLFTAELTKLRNALAENDCETMKQMMRVSTARRARFDKPKNN